VFWYIRKPNIIAQAGMNVLYLLMKTNVINWISLLWYMYLIPYDKTHI